MLSMTLIVGAIIFLTLSVMTLLSRSSEQPQRTLDPYLRSDRSELEQVLGLREICRSVLNTKSLRFVATNAPAEVVSSYGTEQQRLARLSLRFASAALVQRLAHEGSFVSGCSGTLQPLLSKLKHALVLGVCTVGRVGLAVLRGLSTGIPQRLQILVSAKILTNVGNLLVDTERGDKPISKALSDERILCETSTAVSHEGSSLDAVREDILRALRVSLPNDLSRLIFLAILRDNNSGHYYHPEVAQRFSAEVADRAMLACHHQIYERVVALPLEDLTDQLDAYMATVPAPKERLIESWTKLRAYRATIPMDADPISTEIFFMKVEVAVAILEARLPSRIQRLEQK
jgi:hypothetical protein